MDQPYSRIADALLDYQYWAPNDPQQDIYDDTAWTMGELANVEVVRITDNKVLQAPMDRVTTDVRSPGGIVNAGSVFVINHNADNALITFRYRLKDVEMDAAEEPFEAAGRKFNRGSFIIRKANGDELRRVANESGIQLYAVTRCSDSQNASDSRTAHRDDAYVAEHTGRGLVSRRARSIAGAIMPTSARRTFRAIRI